jgi:hypothetical protein
MQDSFNTAMAKLKAMTDEVDALKESLEQMD